MGQACSGVEVGGHRRRFLACRTPGARRQAQITLIGPLHSAILVELSDDALATLRESLSNVVRNAEADAGDVLVGVDMTAKTLTIQVEGNGVGIDPTSRQAGTARSCGAPSPGTTFTPA